MGIIRQEKYVISAKIIVVCDKNLVQDGNMLFFCSMLFANVVK